MEGVRQGSARKDVRQPITGRVLEDNCMAGWWMMFITPQGPRHPLPNACQPLLLELLAVSHLTAILTGTALRYRAAQPRIGVRGVVRDNKTFRMFTACWLRSRIGMMVHEASLIPRFLPLVPSWLSWTISNISSDISYTNQLSTISELCLRILGKECFKLVF